MYVGRKVWACKTPTVDMSKKRYCLWLATINVAANYDASTTRQETLQIQFGNMYDAQNTRNT
jgi:hypothetical protein